MKDREEGKEKKMILQLKVTEHVNSWISSGVIIQHDGPYQDQRGKVTDKSYSYKNTHHHSESRKLAPFANNPLICDEREWDYQH